MDRAAGEAHEAALRVAFDPHLKLEFHGSKVTSVRLTAERLVGAAPAGARASAAAIPASTPSTSTRRILHSSCAWPAITMYGTITKSNMVPLMASWGRP